MRLFARYIYLLSVILLGAVPLVFFGTVIHYGLFGTPNVHDAFTTTVALCFLEIALFLIALFAGEASS